MLSLEPIVTIMGNEVCWIGRFGKEHQKYGDPYTGTMVITRDGYKAFVAAYSGTIITHSERKSLMSMLKNRGIDEVTWDRYRKNSTIHQANVNL